ncbi:MAG: spondin domain-containing protein [Nitrospirota bacterium]|nr:spondin domain-containing protein [Nitrospirota bacterium]
MQIQSIKTLVTLGAVLTLALASGCADNDPAARATYTVTVANATNGQPLAPVAVVLHRTGYTPWQLGMAAGSGLEMLAEGGDPTAFLTDAAGHASVVDMNAGTGLILPGASEAVTVSGSGALRLSLATMLGATNDGFAGLDGVAVDGLAVGESAVFLAPVFDAGTEANTETAATVPALTGTGFDPAREAHDKVLIHRGVVTAADGLATSGLGEAHRFLGLGAVVTVRRDA